RAIDGDGTIGTASTAEVVWVYRRRRRQWLEDWRRGEGSSEFFYGLLSLRARYRVGFVEDEGRAPFARPGYPFERLLAPRLGLGRGPAVPGARPPVRGRLRLLEGHGAGRAMPRADRERRLGCRPRLRDLAGGRRRPSAPHRLHPANGGRRTGERHDHHHPHVD